MANNNNDKDFDNNVIAKLASITIFVIAARSNYLKAPRHQNVAVR
jgi:hypothetical protein